MDFDEYLEEALKDEELRKEYNKLTRKEVKVICLKCGNYITYKNWFSWVWRTPFHWFGKRRTKCTNCGEYSYMGRLK